jgi:2'-hydroxyisoflavone reductase
LTTGADESAPLKVLEDPTTEDVRAHYGALKVACEAVVDEVYPENGLNLRPTVVAGPHDPTDRITYWPYRAGQGGTMVAAGSPNAPIQYIDARDLATFTVDAIESGVTGAFNTVRPAVTWGEFLTAAIAVGGVETEVQWISAEFAREHVQVENGRYGAFPMVVSPEHQAIFALSGARADALGMTHRSLEQTLSETLTWARSRPADYVWQAGLTLAEEAALLASLKAQNKES